MNQADGVIFYVNKYLRSGDPEIIVIENCNLLSNNIMIGNNVRIKISGVYRSHDAEKKTFTHFSNKFMKQNFKVKYHVIIGDFNIDILGPENDNCEFLLDCLDNGYCPLFDTITRYNLNENRVKEGSCTDNIFMKTDLNNTCTYEFKNPFFVRYIIF